LRTTITVDNLRIQVFKANRKSIKLQVSEKGEVLLYAPLTIREDVIAQFLRDHKDWIESKLKIIFSRDPKILRREFIPGESFLYLGDYYRLEIVDNQQEPLVFREDWFYLSKKYKEQAREVFIEWYKEQAKRVIPRRVKWYASVGGFKYNSVRITNAKKRWGSHTKKGNLNFSWRLIMAPLRVIDYVVVHELAHTLEPTHSSRFWGIVKVLMPDYEKWKSWLDEYGYVLVNII